MLRRHGRRVVDEQLVLNPLAAAAIDAYTAAAALSRASRAERLALPSAADEARLAAAWAEDAVGRIPRHLADASEPRPAQQHARLQRLGGDVASRGAQLTPNPLGL